MPDFKIIIELKGGQGTCPIHTDRKLNRFGLCRDCRDQLWTQYSCPCGTRLSLSLADPDQSHYCYKCQDWLTPEVVKKFNERPVDVFYRTDESQEKEPLPEVDDSLCSDCGSPRSPHTRYGPDCRRSP